MSNQKFAEYTKLYKGVSVGILTGDIKFAPDAQILIMTTEILRNQLYKNNNSEFKHKMDIDLDMNTVHSVIFDEVHYINNDDRGTVYEETLILLPSHIILVLLSATINNPLTVSNWLTEIKGVKCNHITKEERVVPLKHHIFYTNRYPKTDKAIDEKLYAQTDKLLTFVDDKCNFSYEPFLTVKKLKESDIKLKNNYTNNKIIIQRTIKFLNRKKMLPCLFFIFSRKKCEEYAKYSDMNLNTASERGEIEKIINYNIHKLYNKDLYLNTTEFLDFKKMVTRGFGFHHSGMINIYKEITEILYCKGLIKVLFATETFAMGVNAPVKTVVFTDLEKYSNDGKRELKTSEYLQMSGRAGRRGKDKIGNVILLGNMMNIPDVHTVRKMTNGKSEDIESKLNTSFSFLLKMMENKSCDMDTFMNNTLMNEEKKLCNDDLQRKMKYQENLITTLPITTISTEDFDRYFNILQKEKKTKGDRKFLKRITTNEVFEEEYQVYVANYKEMEQLEYLNYQLAENNKNHTDIVNKFAFLKENNYLNEDNTLMSKGVIASQINECNEVLMTELATTGFFDDMEGEEIFGTLALFSRTKCLSDDMKVYNHHDLDIPEKLKWKIDEVIELNEKLRAAECEYFGYHINDWELNLDMIEYAYKWSCGFEYNDLNFDNYMGNFIKDIMQLDNLTCTVEVLVQILGKTDVFVKLSDLHPKILRDIVVFESLYIKG